MLGNAVQSSLFLFIGRAYSFAPPLAHFIYGFPFFLFCLYLYAITQAMLPILEEIDKSHNLIMYKLYGDSAVMVDGAPLKDLKRLNRDLNKVILVDNTPSNFRGYEDNTIHIVSFDGNPQDTALLDLIPFLKSTYCCSFFFFFFFFFFLRF